MSANIATKTLKRGTIIVDAIDVDLLTSSVVSGEINRPYAVLRIRKGGGKRRSVYLHRLIVERMTGAPIPVGMVVDHINHNTLDNRRPNLRLCTNAENSRNTNTKPNKAGFKGVYFDPSSGKFRAGIRINNKTKNLGSFPTPEEAHAAYIAAAHKHYGEFANDGNGCLVLSTD